MKIISWNVNGIRAVCKKGFSDWFKKTDADIVCLQEIKARREQAPPEILEIKNYFCHFNPAERPGYSGTAVFSKERPLKMGDKIGLKQFDEEGRFLRLDFSDFILINLYLPHGGRGKENLHYKLKAYIQLLDYLKKIKDRPVVLIGDFNIAHREIDLARPKDNENNIMFTPEEREKVEAIIGAGFIDSFRQFNKETGNYTWWPYFRNARERNLGWRIDYVFVSESLGKELKDAFILNEIKGSDHCPVGIRIFA